jgi:hypothetical protein
VDSIIMSTAISASRSVLCDIALADLCNEVGAYVSYFARCFVFDKTAHPRTLTRERTPVTVRLNSSSST